MRRVYLVGTINIHYGILFLDKRRVAVGVNDPGLCRMPALGCF